MAIQLDNYGVTEQGIYSGSTGSTFTLSGGTTWFEGGYEYHQFDSADDLVVSGTGLVDFAIIAGGGGGGGGVWLGAGNGEGGGGAGGLILTELAAISDGTFPIFVGAGGGQVTNGQNSTFSGYTAIGGGHGAVWANPATVGGSGGGGWFYGAGGSSGGNVGTSGQGYAGGSYTSTAYQGGGGGGSAGNGSNARTPGAGTNVFGLGIKAQGGWGGYNAQYSSGAAGTPHTGNGGNGAGGWYGGSPVYYGGAGGSGTVIVRTRRGFPSGTTVMTTTGCFELPTGCTTMTYILVGGGGGGGGAPYNVYAGGGGGGGCVVTGSTSSPAGGTYCVTVGLGGERGLNHGDLVWHGANGQSSTLSGASVNVSALGGGGGGTPQSPRAGYSHGTGGGSGTDHYITTSGGTGSCGGDGAQGNAGFEYTLAGGGGGAGGNASSWNGGAGLTVVTDLEGSQATYGVGGQGGWAAGNHDGLWGANNTGNGGGGGSTSNAAWADGGRGGSGIVIINYV